VQYEDPVLQAQALSVMPIDRLTAAAADAADASRAMCEQPPLAEEDALAEVDGCIPLVWTVFSCRRVPWCCRTGAPSLDQ
jgi:hypothetical protein